MTWVDGALLLVMVVSAILSFMRGFVREVLGLAAWIGAAVAGFAGRGWLRLFYEQFIEQDWLADAAAVATIFLVVLVVLKLLIHVLANKISQSPLGGVDRSLGTVYGLARGGFLAVLAYILAGLVFTDTTRWPEPIKEARSLPLVVDGARWVASLLPEEYRPRIAAPPDRPVPTQDDLLRPPARNRT